MQTKTIPKMKPLYSKKIAKALCKEFFKNRTSSFIHVNAPKEMGKTDFLLWLMEQSYEFGYFKYFALNQHIENAPFEWEFISDLHTLKTYCRNLGKRVFYFLDELGKSAPKDIPWKKINLELIQELEIIRKYKLTLGSCAIGTVDRRILNANHLDYFIEKTTLTSAKVYSFRRKESFYINDIPKTTIKFKEFDPAYFTLYPQVENRISDRDIDNAVAWAKGEEYQGDLSKPSYYDSVRAGIRKLIDERSVR
jgi:hypothetical protein